MSDYFKRSEKHLDLRPLVKDWAFTVRNDTALLYCDEKQSYKIGQFIAKYILSNRYGRGRFSVPDGIQLSGKIFKHSGFRDGVDIDTSFLETIEIIKRNKKGTLYCAITNNGHSYYFRSEDSSDAFDKVVDESVRHLDSFMHRIMDPNLHIMPLVVLK